MDLESDAGAMFRHAFQGPLRLIDSTERAALTRGADPSVFVRDGGTNGAEALPESSA